MIEAPSAQNMANSSQCGRHVNIKSLRALVSSLQLPLQFYAVVGLKKIKNQLATPVSVWVITQIQVSTCWGSHSHCGCVCKVSISQVQATSASHIYACACVCYVIKWLMQKMSPNFAFSSLSDFGSAGQLWVVFKFNSALQRNQRRQHSLMSRHISLNPFYIKLERKMCLSHSVKGCQRVEKQRQCAETDSIFEKRDRSSGGKLLSHREIQCTTS